VFKPIAKIFLLIATVLLVGQIRIGSNSIAGYFAASVGRGAEWALGELSESGMISQARKWPLLGGLIPAKRRTTSVPNSARSSEFRPKKSEEISQSDRESLMRLLQ
jgi:hypothetical protein